MINSSSRERKKMEPLAPGLDNSCNDSLHTETWEWRKALGWITLAMTHYIRRPVSGEKYRACHMPESYPVLSVTFLLKLKFIENPWLKHQTHLNNLGFYSKNCPRQKRSTGNIAESHLSGCQMSFNSRANNVKHVPQMGVIIFNGKHVPEVANLPESHRIW